MAATVSSVSVFTFAEAVLVASAGPDQRRVAHAADDVLHPGSLGAEVLVRQAVQVEGGQGESLGGGVVGRWLRPPEGGRRRRRMMRSRGEAVGGTVLVAGGVAAGVLILDFGASAGQSSTSLKNQEAPI